MLRNATPAIRRTVILCLAWAIYCPAQQPSPPAQPEPLTMGQAVNEAINKNLDLIAERFNLPIAEARIMTARLRPNPVVSVGGDHLPLLPGYGVDTGSGPPEYAARTDFVFETAGKRRLRMETAEAAMSVAELQLLNSLRTLILNVQGAFVDVLLAKANLQLARENLATFEEIVRVNTNRVRSGDLAEVELIRTQVAQLQFENSVRQAELKVATTRSQLQSLMGRTRADRVPDAIGELRRDARPGTLESLQQTASRARPDLLGQQRDVARSQAELRLQLAQGKVDYTVGSEYRRQQGRAGKGNSLGFFFQTNIPIFNRNQGEVERARLEQRQVEARIRAVRATIESEVDVAFLQFGTAQTILGWLEETLMPRARDVRQITEYSYKRGEATFLEFLDAQRAYNESMQAYNEARAEFARSLYTIDAATGLNLEERNRQ